jgi:hypothetical protein
MTLASSSREDVGLKDIALNAELANGPADLVGCFDRALVVDGHRRTGLGQGQRDGLANAARTAGHQSPFSGQHFGGCCFPYGLVPRGRCFQNGYCAHFQSPWLLSQRSAKVVKSNA